jgi:hypothetical protein
LCHGTQHPFVGQCCLLHFQQVQTYWAPRLSAKIIHFIIQEKKPKSSQ